MAVNLDKFKVDIVNGWKDVLDDKTQTNWALFGYEGQTNNLQFVSKGDGGLEELKDELNSGKIMYAFVKVLDPKTSLSKFILINWQGEGAPQVRKGTCANHIRDVRNLLTGAHLTINARNEEEVEEDVVMEKVVKSTGSTYSFKERIGDADRQTAPVGTVYKRVIPKNEINAVERDKFWQKEEEEEKQRLAEERKRKEQAKLEEKERQEKEAEEMMRKRESPERIVVKRDSIQKEAEEIIKQRNFDARAVFEKNTSAGQMNSRRSSVKENNFYDVQKKSCDPPNSTEKLSETQTTTTSVNNEKQVLDEPPKEVPKVEQNPTAEDEQNTYLDPGFLNETELLEEFVNLGIKAEALYDYQAADETEISFDPGDIITHIDQIDTGWWQGLAPNGTFGLFPANYVQLL
ncbi:drebrin-like protein isoform X2 [Cimex lectularius]|uniref:Drebrin n=1 Tax=Cimex lectularius TaxID=79782 RepID=A0A8I6SRA1_CIMLE|nr:drebrin-like protein isoform X2 [Cimex lectularius]